MLKINLAIALLFFSTNPAWAYLDPGSVSVLLQGILAGVAAFAATSRFWWHKLRGFIKKKFKSENDK